MPLTLRARLQIALVAALTTALVVAGWWVFEFVCDDAYIAFRYVSNRHLGLGYVWNAPPFRPVEGYTSFLWVVLLDAVWTLTGVEPPRACNPLSLAFGLAATGVVGLLAWRLPLEGSLRGRQVLALAAVLLGTATNRTWLTWTSSGLETALFTFLLLSWVAIGVLGRERLAFLWAAAALLALTRPDGLLFLVSTAAIHVASARDGAPRLPAALPALVPLAHLAWRRATYGEWLPNTFFAKSTGLSPLTGLGYLASFLLEHAFWLPLGLAVVAAWLTASRADARRALVGAAVAGQFAYYTLVIGGDHFEYRVYAHLVPLVFLAGVWAADRLVRRPAWVLAAIVLLSEPIPWAHHVLSQQLVTRQETRKLKLPLADYAPLPLRPYLWAFDALQGALSDLHVGTRHREHVVFVESFARTYPPRSEGSRIGPEGLPVHDAFSVGIPGWTLPHVAILDKLGLNDAVVARTAPPAGVHLMAHSRRPPRGYVECFRPDVKVSGGRATVVPREAPLTADEVRACEDRFLAEVKR